MAYAIHALGFGESEPLPRFAHMPLPNSIIATLSPNNSRQVIFILALHGWTHKHPTPEAFPAVVHFIAA
jgi:hypothetical protein